MQKVIGGAKTVSKHVGIVSEHIKSILKKLGYVCVVFLYNPTGFSYYHWAKDFPWKENISMSAGMIVVGLILLGFSIFMIASASKMLEIMGKVITFPILIAMSVAIVYTQWFDRSNLDHWTMLILLNIILFVLMGAIYPRIKWAYFRTRQVDDSDTGDHEDDDQ